MTDEQLDKIVDALVAMNENLTRMTELLMTLTKPLIAVPPIKPIDPDEPMLFDMPGVTSARGATVDPKYAAKGVDPATIPTPPGVKVATKDGVYLFDASGIGKKIADREEDGSLSYRSLGSEEPAPIPADGCMSLTTAIADALDLANHQGLPYDRWLNTVVGRMRICWRGSLTHDDVTRLIYEQTGNTLHAHWDNQR